MSIARLLPTGWSWAIVIVVGLSFAGLVMAEQDAGASAPPPLTVSPHGNLTDGQTVSVSVAPNDYFAPHAAVHILECADPEGSVANLPKDDTTCDGNTIQGGTLLVGADGSFSDPSYPVYLLPSQQLGEQTNDQPICNQSHYCVLYVGLDQNDFTQPKVFSAPFLIAPSTATSTTHGWWRLGGHRRFVEHDCGADDLVRDRARYGGHDGSGGVGQRLVRLGEHRPTHRDRVGRRVGDGPSPHRCAGSPFRTAEDAVSTLDFRGKGRRRRSSTTTFRSISTGSPSAPIGCSTAYWRAPARSCSCSWRPRWPSSASTDSAPCAKPDLA